MAFDHQGQFAGADVDQVEVAGRDLRVRRVDDELAVDPADTDGGDRAHEGDIGERQRGACRIDAENVRLVFSVGAEQAVVDLHFVVVAVREQRADGAIRDAGREDFLLGRTAFALEIAAGEPAGRIKFFAVLDLQREVIDALLGFGGRGDRGKHDGFPQLYRDRAVCLLGEKTRFEPDFLAAHIDFDGLCFIHFFLFLGNKRD